MSASMWASGLAALAVIALSGPVAVHGHGGVLHPWVLGDATHNFLRYPLARCAAGSFDVPVLGGGGEDNAIPGAIPVWSNAAQPTLVLSGSINVWLYLDSNCTDVPTTALWVDLSAADADSGLPYANGSMYAYGMNAPCNNTSPDLYRDNSTLGDDRFNLAWVNSGDADSSGHFLGSAVNAWQARGPAEAAKYPNALTSLIFYPNPAAGAPMCCDLTWNPPPPMAFFQQGEYCITPAPPPPRPPAPPRRSPPPKKAAKPAAVKCKKPPPLRTARG